MKVCSGHWNDLKAVIDKKGLSAFISRDGHAALDEMFKEQEADEDRPYDPLLAANNMIWTAALEAGGLYLMGTDENGDEYCPLCEVDAHLEGGAMDWIEGSTDEIRDDFVTRGWIKPLLN